MPRPTYVLGVDAGNTKTIALVALPDGRIVGTGKAGCGDIYGTTPPEAVAEINRAIDSALNAVQGRRRDLSAGGFSLAGADWPEDYDLLRAQLTPEMAQGAPVTIVNDALGALRAGTSGDGVSIVCGTGTAFGARCGTATWHTSFWGEDAGALRMGNEALRAVVRAELGLDPRTALKQRLMDEMGVQSVEALLHSLTRRGAYRTTLPARLAPAVLDAASAGDVVAHDIVVEIGTVLGEYARVAARKVGLDGQRFDLVLAGGVFRHETHLLRTMIASALPNAKAVDATLEPAAGALLLAFDSLGLWPSLDLMRETLPAQSYFSASGTAA